MIFQIVKRFKKIKSIECNNEIIKEVNSYVYLAILLNKNFDYKALSDFRINNRMKCLDELNFKLKNRMIPIIFKKMLIKNVFLPKISYG